MAEYRIFEMDSGGHITKPAREIVADADFEAINEANLMLDGQDLQVWEGARLVIELRSKNAKS